MSIMKLLLTSSGLTNECLSAKLLEVLSGKENPKTLIVADTKFWEEAGRAYIEEVNAELDAANLPSHYIFDLNKDSLAGDYFDIDLFYVCGGNTFHILHRLRATGLDKVIIQQVESGRSVYLGVSAGSIIAGPDIEIAGWGSEGDENEIGLTDLTGFGFTDMAVFPHFRDELEDEVSEFRRQVSYPVREVGDGEAIYIENGAAEFIY